MCNVTSSPVSCGSDPCKCTQTNVVITAEIWDEGDGLDEITAPNTPTNSLLLNGLNKGLVKAVGIVRATLMYVMFFNCHFNMKCVCGGGLHSDLNPNMARNPKHTLGAMFPDTYPMS